MLLWPLLWLKTRRVFIREGTEEADLLKGGGGGLGGEGETVLPGEGSPRPSCTGPQEESKPVMAGGKG